jgi:4'-phosphopantetheinyl transferase
VIHWALEAGGRPPDAGSLTLAERARLGELRLPKRRADWLLGRVTAKAVAARALAEVLPGEWPAAALEIVTERGGKPWVRLAPEAAPRSEVAPGERLPVDVSISHAEGHALCAATGVGPGGAGADRIGIDLVGLEARSDALVDTFFTDDEQRLVREAAPPDRATCANLVWCAKEAVLKVLGVGLTADTRDLSCLPEPGGADPADWSLAPAGDGWRPFAAACTPALVPGGGTIRGLWRSFPGFVAALAATRRSSP